MLFAMYGIGKPRKQEDVNLSNKSSGKSTAKEAGTIN